MTPEQRKTIDEFAAVARDYCAWVESKKASPNDEIHNCRMLLLKIHQAVIALPKVEPETTDVEENSLKLSYDKIRAGFESWPIDYYWEIFDPLELVADEPVTSSLVNDVFEIYSDIQDGLSAYEQGRFADACWEWKFGFGTHWGHHLVDAQRVIHAYISEND